MKLFDTPTNKTTMMGAALKLQPIKRMAHKRNMVVQWLLRLRHCRI